MVLHFEEFKYLTDIRFRFNQKSKDPFNLNKFFEQIKRDFIKLTNPTVNFTKHKSLPSLIHCDKDMISYAIKGIVDNSIKRSLENGKNEV